MFIITLSTDNDQLIEADLDGTVYFLHVAWNETAGQFTIGLQNADADTLIEGVAMVTAFPLFYRYRHPFMPLGDLMVITNKGQEVSRDSFTEGNAFLVYLTEQDLTDYGVLNKYGRI